MSFDIALVVLLWLVFVPGVVVATFWYQARRGRQLRAWAAASGWTFVGSDPSLVDRWRGAPFGTGRSRKATEVMVGRWSERPVVSFTYSYVTGSGKSQSTHHFHVLALPLPALLPDLELTPDGLGSKLLTMLGAEDIQFESEDFNRAWRVTAADPRFAHDVVHPRLMERLLAPDARGARLHIAGTDILSWAAGPTQTAGITSRLALLAAVIDSVPRYVWQDHGYDPGGIAGGVSG